MRTISLVLITAKKIFSIVYSQKILYWTNQRTCCNLSLKSIFLHSSVYVKQTMKVLNHWERCNTGHTGVVATVGLVNKWLRCYYTFTLKYIALRDQSLLMWRVVVFLQGVDVFSPSLWHLFTCGMVSKSTTGLHVVGVPALPTNPVSEQLIHYYTSSFH